MRAMILAAGRGVRMRPLTDSLPKPMLMVAGRPLIDYQLEALARAGVDRVVVNVAWLGAKLADYLGDGARWGLEIRISDEGASALETGGGIRQALPLLGHDAFWVINGDIWSDYPLQELPAEPAGLAHLILVDNPLHHPQGDFTLLEHHIVEPLRAGPRLTFAGIGCYRRELFDAAPGGAFRLAPLLRQAAARGEVTAAHYQGRWRDIGTPERLQALDAELRLARQGCAGAAGWPVD
ncbi:MAG TPA: nucleotidyltransferase family protein [Nitrococcus sp.]|nr:nucleotidyltransferase family protein [Nitrococcus sp.]